MLTFESAVQYVKGIGEVRAKLYRRLGIETVGDLLSHLPRRYLDLRFPCTIMQAVPGQTAAVRAVVTRIGSEQRIRKGLSIWKVAVCDRWDSMTLTFFNARYAVQGLKEGSEYIFYGKVEGTLLRREMNTPEIYSADQTDLLPVYAQTTGLTSKSMRKNIASALADLKMPPDPLPGQLLLRYDLEPFAKALQMVHFPLSAEQAERGRSRLVFDELLTLSLAMRRLREGRLQKRGEELPRIDLSPFFDALPFSPTGAQRRAIDEACRDLSAPCPMNRLIQGDVGSGKTLVAAACCWYAAQSGHQSVLMAPTEILAQQHFNTLSGLLGQLGMRIALLTGSTTAKNKRAVKAALAAGEIDLCIGTHAVLTDDTVFARLALVVTDEQHRFGVAQRMSLSRKGEAANVLVMSATPIPRTLALIIYGDLELSVIDELPAGRQKIDTYLIDSPKRERAFGYIRKHLEMGLQAYIVCPLVEEDEQEEPSGLKAAAAYAKELQEGPFRDWQIGLLHGRMKAKEKEAVMRSFAAGEIQLLVATTVIEVGIDVPNAVIMMVENADRFGLSQLHQLRGRVGRGTKKSCCILLSDNQSETARRRLGVLRSTADGFQIAEEDLQLRGPGDFFGVQQHGLPPLKIASLAGNTLELARAQQAADELLTLDPGLKNAPVLAARVERMLGMVTGL